MKVLQFFLHLKARTSLIGELPVTMDCSTRKSLLQALHKTPEDVLLNLSSGVLGLARPVKATNIADAYGMGIMTCTMGSYHFNGTALLDGTVREGYTIFEADVPEDDDEENPGGPANY